MKLEKKKWCTVLGRTSAHSLTAWPGPVGNMARQGARACSRFGHCVHDPRGGVARRWMEAMRSLGGASAARGRGTEQG
jgi:hypothetical protein